MNGIAAQRLLLASTFVVATVATGGVRAAEPKPVVSASTRVEDPMLRPPPRPARLISGWTEAVALVREHSTDLKASTAQLARAAGQSRVALAGLLPTVSATGQLTQNVLNKYAPQTPICDSLLGTCSTSVTDQALPRTYLDGAVSIVQPILDLRASYALGTANVAVDAAKLDVDAQKRKIVADLASAIVAVITAERIADLNRSGLRVALERLGVAEQRKTLGGGTRLDALRARQDVDAARVTVLAGDEALKQSREAVGIALGVSGEVGLEANVSLEAIETNVRSACHATELDDRSDVAAARKRREVATRKISEVNRQFTPRLVGQSLLAFSSLSVEPNPVWNVQAVLTVPIWDGGARYGMLRIANADADRAEQDLIATTRGAAVEVARAHRAVVTSESRRDVYSDARAAAVETDELTQTAFHTGQGTSLELILASAQRRQAEINVAVGDFDVVRARVFELLARARCTL